MQIPSSLAEYAALDDDPGRREWITTLPVVVPELADRWELTIGEPFEPGGQCSWVAPVRSRAGADLVLKVGWRHYEAEHEADALRLWNGDGAALLYAAETFDHTSALLMERCHPGTTLEKSMPPEDQDIVIAGLLQRLWGHPLPSEPFRPLTSMCDAWADEFEAKAARTPATTDPGLVAAGIALFRELPRTATDTALLSTDLHHHNVLAAHREPWLVIDPKPYLGDPAYDALQHMLNHEARLAAGPGAFSDRMAGLLDLDPQRLRQWLFARCVQESPEWPALLCIAQQLAP